MNRPADYPLEKEHTSQDNGMTNTMTYAELRDRVQSKQPITDEMIQAVVSGINQRHPQQTDEESASILETLNRLRKKLKPGAR